jgi:hypothetical protein
MHRFVILLLTASGAACASSPPESGPRESGDVPALTQQLLDASTPFEKRLETASVLGRIWIRTGNPEALDAYVRTVRKELADDDSRARQFLELAPLFRDPERRVFALLNTAIQNMRVVSPKMVAAAGAMSDVEATETMMGVIGKTKDAEAAPERDLALRYTGRAARRGRRDAVQFLTMGTQSTNEDIAKKSVAELKLLAGQDAPKGWRAWWLEHQAGNRRSWLAHSFAREGTGFDPANRDHAGGLVLRLSEEADPEPLMWYLEMVLGRKFGYVSPRDVFDPDADPAKLAASNRRAIDTAGEWWRENSPYLFFNPSTNRFDISEEGRRIGAPVDPRTGKPGQ